MFKDNKYRLFYICLAVSVGLSAVMLAFKMFDNFPVTEKLLSLLTILVPSSGAYCLYKDKDEYEGKSKDVYMYILIFFAIRGISGLF